MSFTVAKGNVTTDMSFFLELMKRENKTSLFYEIYSRPNPADSKDVDMSELYEGWILIKEDGSIEFGTPG